jgi:hypothetical protein
MIRAVVYFIHKTSVGNAVSRQEAFDIRAGSFLFGMIIDGLLLSFLQDSSAFIRSGVDLINPDRGYFRNSHALDFNLLEL